ncbi:AraC family transcriptional regulator [Roseibium sp. RKSG952]|uniref:AraC family transcriptional regulator n=1 Tax=Roseibium sp. RKSG952 TaxID=2529384 RepID=UPI0012BC4A29|nr:AraC family transcriptional regulator [Roseibium sp. RKSG952]MTH95964.1 AraC family transcriptional regulator [Roseibium sp. RKSG952]
MMRTPEELAETPDFKADAFSEVLEIIHVRGESARVIAPERPYAMDVAAGNPCVYVVEQGELHVQIGAADPVHLQEGEVALLLQGVAHTAAFSDPRRNIPKARLIDTVSGERVTPAIKCFWGRFSVDGALAAKILDPLPPIIVLADLDENPIEWIDMLCKLVLVELGAERPGASAMVSRLLDLLLVQVLRRWAQSGHTLPGWLAAAKDDRVARAVAAIHADPSRTLTNAELADIAGMSVSSFAERFKKVMGQQPGAYLRTWRLDKAAEALLHSSAPIDAIAQRVGYASKEAFTRAFQAKFDLSPSAWRTSRNG